MENAFKIYFALIPFLILRSVSIVSFYKLGPMTLDLVTPMQTSVIVANGSNWDLYVATSVALNMYRINPSTSTLAYLDQFFGPNYSSSYNRIFIWNSYVIIYATNDMIMKQLTRADLNYYSAFTINQLVDKFYHVPA